MRLFCQSILFLASACATTYDIRTKPSGSKVYVGTQLIGTSPLNFSSVNASSLEGGGVLARVEAEGHQKLFVWLPNDGRHYDLTFNLTPFFRRERIDNLVGDLETNRLDLYRVSDTLLHLQAALMTGTDPKKTSLDQEIQRLTAANPTMGSVYFLDALRLLRDGKKEDGMRALETALKFSPNEYDFLALLNEIKGEKRGTNAKD